MGSPEAGVMGGMMLGVVLLLVILAIAWIIMPFAIIGTKPILRELLEQQRRTNQLLSALEQRQAALASQERPSRIEPSAAMTPISGMVSCPKCSKYNPSTFSACVNCGTSLPTVGQQLQSAS